MSAAYESNRWSGTRSPSGVSSCTRSAPPSSVACSAATMSSGVATDSGVQGWGTGTVGLLCSAGALARGRGPGYRRARRPVGAPAHGPMRILARPPSAAAGSGGDRTRIVDARRGPRDVGARRRTRAVDSPGRSRVVDARRGRRPVDARYRLRLLRGAVDLAVVLALRLLVDEACGLVDVLGRLRGVLLRVAPRRLRCGREHRELLEHGHRGAPPDRKV